MSSAHNFPGSWFGLAQLPDLVAPDAGLADDLEVLHESMANILFFLIGLHVLGALKHQFIDRDGILKGAEFFWTDRHPQARFHASRSQRQGERWRADGELSLRGVARPVTVLFTVGGQSSQLGMKGTATLLRLEFGVGQGEWATTEWIGDEVEIRFDLELTPVDVRP